jgi:hypothetical protein
MPASWLIRRSRPKNHSAWCGWYVPSPRYGARATPSVDLVAAARAWLSASRHRSSQRTTSPAHAETKASVTSSVGRRYPDTAEEKVVGA